LPVSHWSVGRRAKPPDAGAENLAVESNSIAVLPLQSLSDDRDDAYFADGVHEEILTHLSKVAGLKVISRNRCCSTASVRAAREIAQALGVATVLEGTVRRAGGRIRVTAQLINARTDEHLWAENYDGDVAQVFDIQQEIARKIVGALRVRLAPEAGAETQRPTANAAAYDWYLQARVYHARAGNTADNLRAAERLYQRATQADPDFALAFARLSEIHARMYWWSHDHTPARITLAKASLDRAVALAPDMPETHYSAGLYHYWCHREYDRAEVELRRALEAMP
jgi:TolB-like protein